MMIRDSGLLFGPPRMTKQATSVHNDCANFHRN